MTSAAPPRAIPAPSRRPIGIESRRPLSLRACRIIAALVIRASCAIFGDTMPAVRLPAVFLRAGIAIMTYWLALKLFKSDPLALLATLLSYLTPMFLAAGLIMTTDPAYL